MDAGSQWARYLQSYQRNLCERGESLYAQYFVLPRPKVNPLTILAVSYDKESLNRRKEELERAGHLIVPASSQAAAMKFAGEHAYDAALIGFSVPDADADAIAKHAKMLHPNISIVYVRDQHAKRSTTADVIVRPGDATAIIKALDQET